MIQHFNVISVHFFDLDVVIDVGPVNIHLVRNVALVVRDDDKAVMWTIKSDLDVLARKYLFGKDHDAKRVEELGLDGTVERPRAVLWRVSHGHEVLLSFFTDHDLHLAVLETFLHLGKTKVDDLEDVPP